MVWRDGKERPKRYLISVGRDRLRAKILSEMWQICDIEESTMADEIWDALYMHVERHRDLLDKGDGSGLMDKGPQPDLSLPEEKVYDNVFDDAVKDEAVLAVAEEVEEVLDDERTKEPRMATSDMFGHQRGKR
mgnify:CR=1 FL=1